MFIRHAPITSPQWVEGVIVKNLKLSNKIFLLSISIIMVFSLTIGWVYSRLKNNLYQGKQSAVQQLVESTWGIVDHYVDQSQKGLLTETQAKAAAIEAVRHTRFADKNYFFISDTQSRIVLHPIKPELEGKDLSGVRDPDGKLLFVEMAKVAKAAGEGFVSYQWNKPGAEDPVSKISFVKLMPGWNWVIGAGVYQDDVEAELSEVFFLILSIMTAAIICSLLLVYFVSRSVTKPLTATVQMIGELEKGNLDLRLNLDQHDEIGQMAKSLDGFADNMKDEVLAAFEALANGNLTFKANGVIRQPLTKANAALNDVMGQIQIAGEQISSGSNQVAASSESLSQGATEQASSLEEISASLNEMSTQTTTNAENANKANLLATEAQGAAEKGSSQMQHMVKAMSEINAAGQNISKIIKTIDEIAFQTNLLALNAAVEAARAGQHGKGFAVVAEEVRNLAARSAKAAAETADLIEGSVAKTENGSNIANQTAEALQEIVGGIAQVTDLIAEIATASNEQAQGVAQISQGVEQVDQVTQQNTANAEETAAAAEELSGQAEQLQQMLQCFTLSQDQQIQRPTSHTRSSGHANISWTQMEQKPQSTPAQTMQIALDDSDFGKF